MAKKVIRPIRSEAEYDDAIVDIERYFEKEPERGTVDADRFDLLALVIEDYEKKHWPIDPPDPVTAIRYRMETGGYGQSDLGRVLGSRQRASDILTRKRRLTMQMAWKLYRDWGIPAEALIQPDQAKRQRRSRAAR
ncbi:MAG: XRE family transcriptional regulator [Alphaproteobacteria bacterium]|nr:XRE family transcriptional regulator [Alphaproteobacteria bacterium]